MKNFSRSFFACVAVLFTLNFAHAQTPVADFSLSPNPICAGAQLSITDLSTGSPVSWSYTVVTGLGPGGGTVLTTQNPTLTALGQGVFTITLVATNSAGASTPVSHTVQVLPAPAVNINPQNQNTCIGGAVNALSVVAMGGNLNPSYTYSWSSGANTSTVAVSPTATSIYTCVITSTNGCSSVRTATVTFGTPTVNINSVPYFLCPGSNSTLSATGSGGGPYTYTWSSGANTRTISTGVTGVYDVTVTNSNGCAGVQSFTLGTSSTLSVTATAANTLVCAGNNVLLIANGATSYSWSSGSNANTATVNPQANTTYTVTGSAGTCSGTAVISISVNTTPTIVLSASSTSLCSGQNATLTAGGASSYTWIPGGPGTSVQVVSPGANQTYTVRGTNPGCPPRNNTITISVLPSPNISIASSASVICAGEQLALAASGAANYQWSTGAGSTVIIVSPMVTTVYSVTATAANNCTATAVLTQSVSDCTGLDNNTQAFTKFAIYPNPASTKIILTDRTSDNVSIYSSAGNIVKQASIQVSDSSLDLGELPEGLYLLRCGTQQAQLVIVKQ